MLEINHFWGMERNIMMHFVNNTARLAIRPVMLALVGGMLAAAPMSAQAARIDVRTLTCQQAVSMVQSRGAVVFTLTNRSYDRIVKNRFFCDPTEGAENVFAATRDSPRCRIGKRCVMADDMFDFLHNN